MPATQVLERARKAEAEATAIKAQLKSDSTTSKKTIRDLETSLSESTALSSKSEREYITLRDSLVSMKTAWKSDVDALKEDINRREDKWKKADEELGERAREGGRIGASLFAIIPIPLSNGRSKANEKGGYGPFAAQR